jgi:hypothetical protein
VGANDDAPEAQEEFGLQNKKPSAGEGLYQCCEKDQAVTVAGVQASSSPPA